MTEGAKAITRACIAATCILALGSGAARDRAGDATPAQPAGALAQIEAAYADFNDAQGAIGLIDSDPADYATPGYGGRSREGWQERYVSLRAQLLPALAAMSAAGLSAEDVRALELMRTAMADAPAVPESLAPTGRCADARRSAQPLKALQEALYACFAEFGDHLDFEGGTVTRVGAFELLTRLPQSQRRRALFLAFRPLWRQVNGADEPGSPYRRMIALAAGEAQRNGSPVEVAAATLGVRPADTEAWLERILEAWRVSSGQPPVEPWDYRYAAGAAERELDTAIPRSALLPLTQRAYMDLGLDLAAAAVIFDLDPRPGKAPLAYTDYVRRGRLLSGGWQPTLVRVSASYGRGGLGLLNELVHESGHAAHMLALHTRPAFMDLGDPLFYEAFADVPSWSVYEPAWQLRYLGRSVPERESLRALYANVVLDVAWALFDLRMLREPHTDPNLLWTQITSHYLNVRPHPELPWWAVRVQLVHDPGYMVNYGLGAVVTADLRRRIAAQLGPFAAGDPRWFGWLSAHLLARGEAEATAPLLREFLGRPPSPDALLAEIGRLSTQH